MKKNPELEAKREAETEAILDAGLAFVRAFLAGRASLVITPPNSVIATGVGNGWTIRLAIDPPAD